MHSFLGFSIITINDLGKLQLKLNVETRVSQYRF